MRSLWRARAQVEPASARPEQPDEAFAEVLLDEGREELQRADGKASILLSASGVITGALLAGALAGKWNPTKIHHGVAQNVFWVGVAAGVSGLLCLASAVTPRTKNSGSKESLAYFGHVIRFRERGVALRPSKRKARIVRAKADLRTAITKASAGRFDRAVDQVWEVSSIVYKKYRRIRWALLAYSVGAALCAAALVIEARA